MKNVTIVDPLEHAKETRRELCEDAFTQPSCRCALKKRDDELERRACHPALLRTRFAKCGT